MAATTTKTKIPTAKVAKLRRSGATWQEVRDDLGVKTSSGAFTAALLEDGFGADGVKLDGSGPQTTKAKVRGSANGAKPKAKGKTAAKKGTAKKGTAKKTAAKGKGKSARVVRKGKAKNPDPQA